MNENSLKRLNGYLESLQKPGRSSVHPTKLTFYVRETKENNNVQNDVLATGQYPPPKAFHTSSLSFYSIRVIEYNCYPVDFLPAFPRVPFSELHPADQRCTEHSD